jgi:hypothetical protein
LKNFYVFIHDGFGKANGDMTGFPKVYDLPRITAKERENENVCANHNLGHFLALTS